MRTLRILLVDDDAEYRESLARSLKATGHTVTEAAGRKSALEAFDPDEFDLVVTDMDMEKPKSGLYLILDIRESLCYIPIVVLSGDVTDSMRTDLTGLKVKTILNKSPDHQKTIAAILN